jgi:hypothetical protein
MTMNDETAPIQLTIAPASPAPCFADTIPLSIGLGNRSDASVRMLDVFEPTPVFFSFAIVRADGTPVIVAGGGKIDFGPGQLHYRELKKGDVHTVAVDLAAVVHPRLRPGSYTVSATYHNQYGEECFRGVVSSNSIAIRICEPEEPR